MVTEYTSASVVNYAPVSVTAVKQNHQQDLYEH